jgi:hypothetical protein
MALYHYTTEKRHDKILQSQTLKPSLDTMHDASCGEGWYFTDLPPGTCEKILMLFCWNKGTLSQRVQYYISIEVVGGVPSRVRDHVYYVPLNPKVSFRSLSSGEVPECPLKPCYTCDKNPENT